MPVRDLYDRVLAEVERPLLRLVLGATRGQPDQGGGHARPEPQHATEEDP